jgi:hypothetical protein
MKRKSSPKPKPKPISPPAAVAKPIPAFTMTDAVAGVPVIRKISQEFSTGMKYAWGLLKVNVGITTDVPPGKPWATWDLPLIPIPIYIIVEVTIIGRTLIAGFLKIT